MVYASPWDEAPPGWVPLEFLADVIAEDALCDAKHAARILRPLIEAGALPCRDVIMMHSFVEPGDPLVMSTAHGMPLEPDWAHVFSEHGAEMRKRIEVNYATALEAVHRALIRKAASPDVSGGTNDQGAHRRRGAGGRPALPEKEQFQAEIRRRLLLDGVNVNRKDLLREMLKWAEEHFESQPDRRTLDRWFGEHAPKEL